MSAPEGGAVPARGVRPGLAGRWAGWAAAGVESVRRGARAVDPDTRVFLIGYLLLLPVYLAPILRTRFLPGLDLPFHLSIADMLRKAGDPDSPYAAFYEPRLSLAPYAAHYLLLLGIGKLVALDLAHAAIMVAYVAALPLAAAGFLAACGRSRLPALLAFPLAYNLTLHYGFVSFCLSLPVLLLLLALLARLLHAEARPRAAWRGPWALTALAAAAAFALFLCHLQNFLFGVCAAVAVLGFNRAPLRRRAQGLLALTPALAALLWWALRAGFAQGPGGQGGGLAFAWHELKAARLADLRWGALPLRAELGERLGYLPEQMLKGFGDGSDVAAARVLLAAIGLYVLLGAIAHELGGPPARPPRLRVASWLLLLGAALAFFALPHHLRSFELMTFYPRFSVLVALFLLPLVPAALARVRGWPRVALLLPALLAGGHHGRLLNRHYAAYRDELSDFRHVLRAIPPDGKLVSLIYDRRASALRIESPLVGVAGFYVARRHMPRAMVPLAYCGMRHIPCALRAGAPPVPFPGPWLDQPYSPDAMVDHFDYFLLRSPPPDHPLAARAEARLLAQRGSWSVYGKRVSRPARGPVRVAPAPGAD